jgi:hypothetical protein
MASGTAVQVTTRNITATDVRTVMAQMGMEMGTIIQFAESRGISIDCDFDKTIVDISMLAMNDVIASAHLQFYQGDTLVREYQYIIQSEGRGSSGPPPNQPPLPTSLPSGVDLRLTVKRNPSMSVTNCNAWFERLGWATSGKLAVPNNYEIDRVLLSGDDEDDDKSYGRRR